MTKHQIAAALLAAAAAAAAAPPPGAWTADWPALARWVLPAPTGPLAEAVEDATDRRRVAAYLNAWAATLDDQACPLASTGQFRRAYRSGVRLLKSTGELGDYPRLDERLDERLTEAVGLADQPLDAPTRATLSATLAAAAAELRGGA